MKIILVNNDKKEMVKKIESTFGKESIEHIHTDMSHIFSIVEMKNKIEYTIIDESVVQYLSSKKQEVNIEMVLCDIEQILTTEQTSIVNDCADKGLFYIDFSKTPVPCCIKESNVWKFTLLKSNDTVLVKENIIGNIEDIINRTVLYYKHLYKTETKPLMRIVTNNNNIVVTVFDKEVELIKVKSKSEKSLNKN